jgi:hypothetical protein
MKVDGRCVCGHVSYEAEIDPDQVGICHCTDCQTFSGSAFRVGVPTAEQDFRLLSGGLKTYEKTAQSGTKRAQAFCPECGTHFYSTSVGDGPKILRLRVGSMSQRHALPPKAQIWRRSAQPWLTEIDTIASREQQ